MTNKNKTYTVCYDSLDVFNDKKSAKDFYMACYRMSEGAEQKRYADILVGLDSTNLAKDNISNHCNRINIQLDSKTDTYLNINLDDNLSIEDTIKYYEDYIIPILDLSKEYDVDFNNKIPFEEFGADSDYNMASFSKFYKELLSKFNVEMEYVSTDSFSDGKYEMTVERGPIFKVYAWDNIEDVLSNVESIINLYEMFKEKEVNELDDTEIEEETKYVDSNIGKGWTWHKYYDGTGCLKSPDGKEYMEYDLNTNEYKETPNSSWEFLPLIYYYGDGYEPDEFKPFEYMEEEMINNVLPREKTKQKKVNELEI